MATNTKELLQSAARPILWLHHRLLPRDEWVSWIPYLWLCFLPFFFFNYTSRTFPAFWWLWAGAGALAFVALYFRTYHAICHAPQELPWLIGGIALLGYLFVVIPPYNGYTFIIYAAAFCGTLGSIRKGSFALFGIVGLFVIEGLAAHWFFQAPNMTWASGTFMGLIIGLANVYYGELRRKNKAIRQSQEEIRRLAATAERERIARDLHDLLGHTLTLITVKAELAAKLAERDMTGAAREIREVERISREALAQVREAVGGYRNGGLAGELINARIALGTAGIALKECAIQAELPAEHDRAFAWVLREAVTNVVRHSGARECRIRVEQSEGEAQLWVEDDGRGGRFEEGNGLKGMRERLAKLAGHLKIESTLAGTCLHARLPLSPVFGLADTEPLAAG